MTRAFAPDYAVHPGETLLEWLEEIGWNQTDLSSHSGVSTKHINRYIKGHVGVSARTAVAFERACGISARVLLRLQADYEWFVASHEEATP